MTDGDDDPARAATIASDAEAVSAASGSDARASDAPGRTSGTFMVGPGSQLGRYALGDELGAGGMASVFQARDTTLRRDVAVKVLFPHLARKPELARRFQREARAAAGLEHPNILRVYDVGVGDPPYIVMELVRGHSLREIAEHDAPLLAELVAAIGALLCDALAVAHAAKIVHRDVKPANVMLADDGRLLLADFGVARLEDDDSLQTKSGALLGTVSFMAPEQGQGRAVDGRSDLYAVGVTLYQLAVGALPFTGAPAKILADAHRGAVAASRRSSQVGAPLSRVIERLMAPDPDGRPADAATAAAALREVMTTGGLDDAAAELRAFVADRAAYRAARVPQVAVALERAAQAAASRGATAAALGHCDRLLALVPDHAGATALVARLTRSDAQRRRLRLLGGAIAVTATVGGGWFAAGRLFGATGARVEPDAAIDSAIDGPAIDGPAIDAAIDGPAIDGPAIDGAAIARRPDTGTSRIDPTVVTLAIDGGAIDASIDAAAIAVVTGPVTGTVVLEFDAWCDLTIDDRPAGRASRAPIELAAGAHRLACSQGLGLGSWTQTVDVIAGKRTVVKGSLVAPVVVENRLRDTVRLRDRTVAPGQTAELRPGPVRVDRIRGDEVIADRWVTIPRVARCVLRDTPSLDCYP